MDITPQLEALRQRFRHKTEATLDAIVDACASLREGRGQSDEVLKVYQMLHRLAGSAGTFGFDELGRRARALEIRLKPGAEALRRGEPEALAQCYQAMDERFFAAIEQLGPALADVSRSPTPAELSGNGPVAGGKGSTRTLEPLVWVIDDADDAGLQLYRDLTLHGFRTRHFASLNQDPESLQDVDAIVIRDTLLDIMERLPDDLLSGIPVVCLGREDGFLSRYRLAERGVDGFVIEPLDVPLLADHIDRLIAERDEAGQGRVLIVDDDPELLEHYRLVLEQGGFEVRNVNDPTSILGALSEFRPDLVLMDVQMGPFSGPQLARMLRFDPQWLGLPIIFLSSEEDPAFQLEALAKGGDDFVSKPLSDQFLLRSVSVRCYRARQLDKLASRDSLTGLLKHALVKAEVHKEYARSQRLKHPSSVAMLDLDHFKAVNDTYGHRMGDLVIKGLANLLRHRLRKSDIIGRYGGEEFLVALSDCPAERAGEILQSVCDQLARIVFTSDSQEFSVTMSVGVAELNRYDSAEAALEAADQALYQRKRQGRNGVTLAS